MNNQLSTETLDINSFQDLMNFADRISKSSMIPKEYMGRPDNIMVAVMMGKELGLKPFQAMQSIATINGRPSIYGDAALALVMVNKDFQDIQEDDFETIKKNKKATCIVVRKGRTPTMKSFDFDDAKKANLIGKAGPWTQYEPRMYQMRARAFALRDAFPDVLKGIHIAEEAQDMPAEKEINPVNDNPIKSKINELIEQKKSALTGAVQTNDVKEKYAQAHSNQDDSDLSIVINKISAATTIDELKATKEFADMLSNEEEKVSARNHYDVKRQELKAKFIEQAAASQSNDTWGDDYDKAKTL